MRRRRRFVAVLLTSVAALVTLAPAPPAGAATADCHWVAATFDPPGLPGFDGWLHAGPLFELGATSVDVTCSIVRDDGFVKLSKTQNTPGSAGFHASGWDLSPTIAGRTYYACTTTKAYPSGTTTDRGCSFAFTG